MTGISTPDFGQENDYKKGIGDDKIQAELAGGSEAEDSDCIDSIRLDASLGSACRATRRNPMKT